MKKRILSIAILATLPLTAMADMWNEGLGKNYTYNTVNTPTGVPTNGTVTLAKTSRPYQTLTVDNDDKTHIASTAYVKGAYNDTIAAVNAVAYDVGEKQNNLYFDDDGTPVFISPELYDNLDNITDNSVLPTGMAVKNAITAVDTKIDNKRVKIYTTWDDDRDSATREVAFVTASGN